MLFLKDVAPAGTLLLKDVGIGVETRVPAGDGFMIMTGSRDAPVVEATTFDSTSVTFDDTTLTFDEAA